MAQAEACGLSLYLACVSARTMPRQLGPGCLELLPGDLLLKLGRQGSALQGSFGGLPQAMLGHGFRQLLQFGLSARLRQPGHGCHRGGDGRSSPVRIVVYAGMGALHGAAVPCLQLHPSQP